VQLATAVVFGLAFSTTMILLVTPVWLLVPYRAEHMFARLRVRTSSWLAHFRGRNAAARRTDTVELLSDETDHAGEEPGEKPDKILPAAE